MGISFAKDTVPHDSKIGRKRHELLAAHQDTYISHPGQSEIVSSVSIPIEHSTVQDMFVMNQLRYNVVTPWMAPTEFAPKMSHPVAASTTVDRKQSSNISMTVDNEYLHSA